MNLDTSTSTIRAKVLSPDPSVLDTVQTATNLVQDLKALQLLQEYLSKVSSEAANTSNDVIENPASSLKKYTQQMRNFICGYVLTHDETLSAMSEIPASKLYAEPETNKNPIHFESVLANPLLVPAIPGNLFYMACGDNLQQHNLDLYTAYTLAKNLPENSNTTSSQIIANLLPYYPVPGLRSGTNQIPQTLLARWASLIDMSATNSWILDGLTVSTELAELVAIIGLRTVVNYKAFMCLRQLDKALEEIPHNVATAMKSLYQQAGYTSHPQVWLSNLKSTLKNPTSISTILMEYFTHKRIFDEYQDTWNSLSSVPSNSNTTPNELISVLSENSSYNDAAVKSSTYVNNLLSILLSAYGGSTSLNNTQRFDLFETTFETWKNTINSFGGVTGAEGLIAVVAINQLERISNYSALPTANDETLTSLGQEGLEITKYLSNTPFLEDAFAGLAS